MRSFYFLAKSAKWPGFFILFVCLAFFAPAQPVLKFIPIPTSALNIPVYVTNAGDGSNRLFIVEKGGVIKVYDGDSVLATPFLDITKKIISKGEQGLLSIAFHPDYKTNRYFFVYYNNSNRDVTIARYQTSANNPNVADSSSGVVLLNLSKTQTNHNGGTLAFGKDGYLYFATGDGGGVGDPNNNAQNGKSLFGKIIRLNVTTSIDPPYYTIPEDNPFVNDSTVRDEIWDLGLRNPFRWSFDRLTGDIWIGDVGQNDREEVDFEPDSGSGGINYGWRCYEANLAYNTTGCLAANNYTSPIFSYDHSAESGGNSVIGGMVYRGNNFPLLYGYYICVDHFTGNGWLINSNNTGGWSIKMQAGLPTSIGSFGEDENGELYAISLAGTLYRVESKETLPVRLTDWQAQLQKDIVSLAWKTTFEQNLRQFDIEFSTDGLSFKKLATIEAKNISSGSSYTYSYRLGSVTKLFYRLNLIEQDGSSQYSKVISLDAEDIARTLVYPNVIGNRVLNIQLNQPFTNLTLFSTDGKKVFEHYLKSENRRVSIELPSLAAGVYFVWLYNSRDKVLQKIVIQ